MQESTTLGSWLVHVLRKADGAMSMEEALHVLMDSLSEFFPCQSSALILIDDVTKAMSIKISRHISYTFSKQFRRDLGTAGEDVVMGQKPLMLNNLSQTDPQYAEFKLEHEFSSAVIAPLIKNKRGVGYIYCDRIEGELFNEADLLHLQVLGYIIGNIMEKFDLLKSTFKLSQIDDVTNVLQYRAFITQFSNELERARMHDYEIGLLLISADMFRSYVSTYGVDDAHRLLADIAAEARKHIRDVDLIARFGADQFIMCFSGFSSRKLQAMQEEMLQGIVSKVRGKGGETVKISVGSLHLPNKAALSQQLQDILAALGHSVVEAKRAGINRA
jgi:diguanylate cyclase (GGDEF)-like protein